MRVLLARGGGQPRCARGRAQGAEVRRILSVSVRELSCVIRPGCSVWTVDVDFSNVLSKTAIERLADADEYEVVRDGADVSAPTPHEPDGADQRIYMPF